VKHRRVLLDGSFIEVLLDPCDVRHNVARAAFERLLAEYEDGGTLLYSHAGAVGDFGDPRAADIVAVCDVARLDRWLRRDSERVAHAHHDVGVRRATALVLMHRWGIDEIASFDAFFLANGIGTVPVDIGAARSGQLLEANGETFAKRSGVFTDT